MCGIAGFLGTDPRIVQTALDAMTAAQIHRGPDDSGQTLVPFGNRFLGLGHRRLSILDLSAAGHQPMVHPDTGDQLIFNGEIYNYLELRDALKSEGVRFAGHGDTEALLHGLSRWGAGCVPRLKGMFAFAFYNVREQSLLLARDPVGIKPLYVARIPGGGIAFASEVRAILASGAVSREWDIQAVASLLAYGAVQQPHTVFAAIRSFPPGCHQVISAQRPDDPPSPQRYWRFPDCDRSVTEDQAVERVRATVNDAVKDHLVADVPVGVFLSSGLDSSIVGMIAARHSPLMKAFTVGFADQPDMSEAPIAAETARLAGLDHHDIQITGADAEAAVVPWLESIDQPSIDGLNTYVISQAVRRAGITVALSGMGGDELFGGYASFTDVPRLRTMLRLLSWIPAPLRRAMLGAAAMRRSRAVREKLLDISGCRAHVFDLYLQRRRMMSNGQLRTLGIDARRLGLNDGFLSEAAMDGVQFSGDMIADISRLECQFYQGNMLLRDTDANGMAHGLEIRVPLLDQRVIDLACSIPGAVRLPPRGRSKHLLRKAFAPEIRPELSQLRKRGFTLPIRRWMLGPLREHCEHSLRLLKENETLQPHGVDAVWSAFLREPESPIWTRAFMLCVLGFYMGKMSPTPGTTRVTGAARCPGAT